MCLIRPNLFHVCDASGPTGGSCCNLSRGSFETVARRRRRRDPHRQHGGSLEDLSAIDETSAGAGRAKSSVSESGKHGGSLQNIQQEATAGGGGGGDFRPPAEQPAPPPVIEIDVEEEAEVVTVKRPEPRSAQASPRVAAGATAAPEGGAPPEREQQRPDDTVEFPLKLEQVRSAARWPAGTGALVCNATELVGELVWAEGVKLFSLDFQWVLLATYLFSEQIVSSLSLRAAVASVRRTK